MSSPASLPPSADAVDPAPAAAPALAPAAESHVVRARRRRRRRAEPRLAIGLALAPSLLGEQSRTHGLVLQAVGLDILQALHLGGGSVFQQREVGAFLLGLVLLVGKLQALLGEVAVEGIEPIEVVGRRVVDHFHEGIDLDLVFGCLEAGQQWYAGAARAGVAADRNVLDGQLQCLHLALQRGDLGLQLCLLNGQLVDSGLRREVRIGGGIGPFAGIGDLGGGLLGVRLGCSGAPGRRRQQRREQAHRRDKHQNPTHPDAQGTSANTVPTGISYSEWR